jgi:hypothetical protein
MNDLSEEEILKRLLAKREKFKVTHEEITHPDYEMWGRAREWHYHQGVCLFAGLTPVSKPYFEIIINEQSPFDLIHWYVYYPTEITDRNRLKNIYRLLQQIPQVFNAKKQGHTIPPKTLTDLCKGIINTTQLPPRLIEVVNTLGPHLSLNLPSTFCPLEIDPSALENLKKFKERKTMPLVFNSVVKEDPLPSVPPLPPKPTESPLLLSKRLYPLQRSERWIEADGLSLNEVILLYYDIDPEGIYQSHLPGEPIDEQAKEFLEYLNHYFYGDRQLLISQIDEKKIVDLIRRSIHVGSLKISNQGIFSSAEIVTWMKSKNLSFPIPEPGNRKASQPGSEDNLKQAILAYDMERLRPEQQGKLLCRIVASSLWKADKTFKLPNIQKHPRFKKAVLLAQEIMNKSDPIEPKTIEDWVRDINPNYSPKK